MKHLKPFLFFLYLAAVSLVLLWPAFWNGYPLVFSDTGTYVFSAFTQELPFDRPIGYGYFIRLFSLGLSLWFVVYAQAFLACYFLWKILKVFFEKNFYFIHFFAIIALSFFTILPWTVSQIMPDIFPALIFLLLSVFVFGKLSRVEKIFFAVLLMFFLITHTANFLLSLGFLFFTFLFVRFRKSFSKQRKVYSKHILLLTAVTFFAPLFFIAGNFREGYGFVISPSSHAFMMSRMNDAGVLDAFLEENCRQKDYELCSYRGNLERGEAFLWGDEGPLSFDDAWMRLKPEFDTILQQIYRTPKFVAAFAGDSVSRSAQLFFMIGMDYYSSYGEKGPVYPQIKKFFPEDLPKFTGARQYEGQLQYVASFHSVFVLTHLFAFGFVFWMFFKKRYQDFDKIFVYETVIFFALNAGIMATLSGAYGRYQQRLAWLLPLICFVFFIKKYYSANFSK